MSNIHVRYNGYSYDLTFEELDLGDMSNDNEIKQAVATYLDTPVSKLNNFQLSRNANTGNITLHPAAVFGVLEVL